MENPFLKDFDTLLDALLTDYRNQYPDADVSQGSLIFIKSACLASALWGLYKYQDWIMAQVFPDTAASAHLEHHANVRGLTRRNGESDAELLARLLETLRTPPAGGNAADYVRWAKEVDGVGQAYCVPLAQGPGTVDVLVLASGDSETPDQDLLDAVYAHIDALRPVTASTMRVQAPGVLTQNVSMTVDGDNLVTSVIEDEIEVYLNSMIPGADLALTQLSAIAIANGATDAVLTTPSANVVTAANQMIRAGVVNVAESS